MKERTPSQYKHTHTHLHRDTEGGMSNEDLTPHILSADWRIR